MACTRGGSGDATVRRGGRGHRNASPHAWPVFEALEARVLLSAAEPTAFDQYMLELVNRARADPAAEAARFGIDLNEGLPAGTLSAEPREPLAVNGFVTRAAQLHTADLLANFSQLPADHRGSDGRDPSQRVSDQIGFPVAAGENNAFVSHSGALTAAAVDRLHRLLFMDFIPGGFEVVGRGHRKVMLNGTRNEAGAGVLSGRFGTRAAALATIDFITTASHSITGVAFSDTVESNHFYTPGEGLGGVKVSAVRQGDNLTLEATTLAAGGYALSVPDGTYTVTASGGPLAAPIQVTGVALSGRNVKVDFETGPLPGDLSAQIKAVNLPSLLVAGQSAAAGTVSVVVASNGPGNAQGVVDLEFIASRNADLGDADDVALGVLRDQSVNLAPTSAKTVVAGVQLPADLPAGTYRVFVRVDSTSRLVESNENNNTASVPAVFTVAPPFQDLAVAAVSTTLPDVLIPGDRGKVAVTVTNLGNIPASGPARIHLELAPSRGGPPHELATVPVTLRLSPGGSARFNLPAVLGAEAPEDEYRIQARVETLAPLVDAEAGNDRQAAPQVVRLEHAFGSVPGRPRPAIMSFLLDGDRVTFSLKGPGRGDVAVDPQGRVSVALHDTTPATGVTLAVKPQGGDGVAPLGSVATDGPVKSFAAPAADLQGDLTVEGGASLISLRDAGGGHRLVIQGAADPAAALTLRLREVRDLSVRSSLGIKSLTVNSWTDSDGTADRIEAPWLGAAVSRGDFAASLDLADAARPVTLRSLKVAGWLGRPARSGPDDYLEVRSAGHMGTITAGGIRHSAVLAGVTASGPGLPDSAGDFGANHAQVKTVMVRGIPGAAAGAASFIDSRVAAWTVRSASLKIVEAANSGVALGLAADWIGSLVFQALGANGGKPVKLSKLNSLGDLGLSVHNPAGIGFPLADMEVRPL